MAKCVGMHTLLPVLSTLIFVIIIQPMHHCPQAVRQYLGLYFLGLTWQA